MTVVNTKQVVNFSAHQVMSSDLTEEQKVLMEAFFNASSPEEKETAKAAFDSSLDKFQKKDLEVLGVESPLDRVPVVYKLGNLLFDMYQSNVPVPLAPFPKAAEENRRAKFVELLDKDVITEVPTEVVNASLEVMNDEEKWTKMNFFAWVEQKNGMNRFIPINGNGINFYQAVITAACNLLAPQEEPSLEEAK